MKSAKRIGKYLRIHDDDMMIHIIPIDKIVSIHEHGSNGEVSYIHIDLYGDKYFAYKGFTADEVSKVIINGFEVNKE